MFSERSRYARAGTDTIDGGDGRVIVATRIPFRPVPPSRGFVRPADGQRADHLAAQHLGDPTAFWRLCDANGAMSPDVLMRRPTIAIPVRER